MDNYVEYKKAYEALQTTFNPVKFDPERWAKAARDAGMKYVVFTTKHHDGFSMFGTKMTKYNIVDATPFRRDVVRRRSHLQRRPAVRRPSGNGRVARREFRASEL